MKQSIVWTALPNGVRRATNSSRWIAHISVFVTPRLAPNKGGGVLGDFEYWHDWPETLRSWASAGRFLDVHLADSGNVRAPLAVSAAQLPDSNAWRALLPPTTPVQSVKPPPPKALSSPNAGVTTFRSTKLVEEVRDAYAGAIALTRNPQAKSSRDPLRAFRAVRADGALMAGDSAVSEFVSFHRALERKGTATAPSDVLTGRPDFHQKISALSAHPAVLRQLGLIIDLDVPVEALGLTDRLNDLRLRVVPNGLPDDIELHSFWTAAEYASAGTQQYQVFAVRDKEHPKSYGFYALNRQPMTLVQEQFEHATMSLIQHASGQQSSTALPRLQQGGMRILDPRIPAQIRSAIGDRQALEQMLQSPLKMSAGAAPSEEQTLYAEQLTRGYRIDVTDVDAGEWRSLCERTNHYSADSWSWPAGGERYVDEGAVEFTAFESTRALTPDLHVIEDLFNWDGWSLAVPRPGASDTTAQRSNDASKLEIDIKVQPGSLQPQRFGHCYQFRARRVDIAGNSISADEAAMLFDQLPAQQLASRPTCCLRVESALPPVVFPAETDRIGDEDDVLIIRSAEARRYQTKRCRAHLFPPQISVDMAERHGLFDGLAPAASWALIASHRGSLDRDENGAPRTMIPHGFARAPYLPDPMVTQAVMTLPDGSPPLALPRFDDLSDVRKSGALARSCLLTVRPGKNEIVSSIRGHEITLHAPIGRVKEVKVASRPAELDLHKMALVHEDWHDGTGLSSTTADAIKAAAKKGQAEMLAPTRVIKIVHACQRPLTTPVFGAAQLLARERDETHAVFVDPKLLFDVQSTGRLDAYATWDDITDNPGTRGFETSRHELHAGGIDISDEDTTPLTETPATPGQRLPLSHDFGDTRHHAVRYRLSALSRFIDLYPPELSSDPDNMNRMSAEVLLHVPSTAPPAIPAVAHVLPTFRHQSAAQSRGVVAAEQQGDGLRIYMQRGWFSSGNNEQLALVMATDALPDARRDEACDWGVNTLRDTADLPGPLRAEHITSGVESAAAPAIGGGGLTLKLHDVHFSDEHQLPFVDITFVPSMSFMPLVRLVLARYQPFAIDGCHLSPTTQTDFVPLAPGRALSIEKQNAGEWQLTLRGYSYRNKTTQQHGRTSVVMAHIEVLSVNTPQQDAVWMAIDEPVTLEARRVGDYDYQWTGGLRIDTTEWPKRQWRRRLVVREYEPLTVEGISEAALADHSRLVSAHTVDI